MKITIDELNVRLNSLETVTTIETYELTAKVKGIANRQFKDNGKLETMEGAQLLLSGIDATNEASMFKGMVISNGNVAANLFNQIEINGKPLTFESNGTPKLKDVRAGIIAHPKGFIFAKLTVQITPIGFSLKTGKKAVKGELSVKNNPLVRVIAGEITTVEEQRITKEMQSLL